VVLVLIVIVVAVVVVAGRKLLEKSRSLPVLVLLLVGTVLLEVPKMASVKDGPAVFFGSSVFFVFLMLLVPISEEIGSFVFILLLLD